MKHIWIPPGAEEEHVSVSASEASINVIDDGSCNLVFPTGLNEPAHLRMKDFLRKH